MFINWRATDPSVVYRPHVPLHKDPSNLPHLEKNKIVENNNISIDWNIVIRFVPDKPL